MREAENVRMGDQTTGVARGDKRMAAGRTERRAQVIEAIVRVVEGRLV